MVTQDWRYSRGVSKNHNLLLYSKEVEAIVEEKVSWGMDGEGREVQTHMRRLLPLHCEVY